MFKRVFFFLLTNAAVMLVLSIAMNVLGITSTASANYGSLLALAAVVGFAGAFISLAMSKFVAKRGTGMQIIETPQNATEQWLLDTVRRQSEMAGIGMPEVGIFAGNSPNAFATGMTKNSSLVAVNTALLAQMSPEEVEAVLGHEVAHIANGDMVTLTLLQGVLNTFVFFFARVISGLINSQSRNGQSSSAGFGYYIGVFVAEVLLGFLATMIVAWYSRQREFKADEGGAKYASKAAMISALERLASPQDAAEAELPDALVAFGISPSRSKFGALFATHPPLSVRIAHLQNYQAPRNG